MLYKTIAFFLLLITSVSYAQEVRKIVQQKLPDYKIINQCKGNFTDAQFEEDVFALFDAKANTALYVAVLGKDNKNIVELKKTTIADKNFRESSIEIACASFTKVEQLNNIIKTSEGRYLGEIRGKPNFSTVCLANVLAPAERNCFMYDITQKKFVSAGGWKN
jgi:hypothetical protein